MLSCLIVNPSLGCCLTQRLLTITSQSPSLFQQHILFSLYLTLLFSFLLVLRLFVLMFQSNSTEINIQQQQLQIGLLGLQYNSKSQI